MKYSLGVFSGILGRGGSKSGQLLLKWNVILGVFFVVEGVALLILSVPRDVAFYAGYLANDSLQSALQHTTVTTAAIHQLAMVNITYLVAALCFVAALAHIIRATVKRGNYGVRLEQRNVLLHPAQIAGEAAVLFVLLGLLGGIYDIGSFVLMLACAAVLGLALSVICTVRTGTGKQNNGAVLAKAGNVLWLAGLVPLSVILLHMVAGNVFGAHTPAHVYLAYVVTLAFAVAMAVNTGLVRRQAGKQGPAVRSTEWRFMAINAVGITLVCAVLFAGLLRP